MAPKKKAEEIEELGEVTVSTEITVEPPPYIHTIPSNGGVFIRWHGVNGAQEYHLFRDGVEILRTTQTSYRDTSGELQRRVQYNYHVLAMRDGIISQPSPISGSRKG